MSVIRVNRIVGLGNTGPEFTNGVRFPAGTFENIADKIDIDTVGIATFSNLNASTVSVANSVTALSYTGNVRNLTISGTKMPEAIALISVLA